MGNSNSNPWNPAPIWTPPPPVITTNVNDNNWKNERKWTTYKLPYKTNTLLIQNDQLQYCPKGTNQACSSIGVFVPGSNHKKLLPATLYGPGHIDVDEGHRYETIENTRYWNGAESSRIIANNYVNNEYKIPPASYPFDRTPCMAKIQNIDNFSTGNKNIEKKNTSNSKLSDNLDYLDFNIENFEENLTQRTQSCTTNLYIGLIIIAIIIIYLLNNEKTEFVSYQ